MYTVQCTQYNVHITDKKYFCCLIYLNNKLINYKINLVISIIPLAEKNSEKNWNLFVSGSAIPGSGSADPDPHQNEADPKHCYTQ